MPVLHDQLRTAFSPSLVTAIAARLQAAMELHSGHDVLLGLAQSGLAAMR
jgi:hypothetical protein